MRRRTSSLKTRPGSASRRRRAWWSARSGPSEAGSSGPCRVNSARCFLGARARAARGLVSVPTTGMPGPFQWYRSGITGARGRRRRGCAQRAPPRLRRAPASRHEDPTTNKEGVRVIPDCTGEHDGVHGPTSVGSRGSGEAVREGVGHQPERPAVGGAAGLPPRPPSHARVRRIFAPVVCPCCAGTGQLAAAGRSMDEAAAGQSSGAVSVRLRLAVEGLPRQGSMKQSGESSGLHPRRIP